MYLFLEMVWLGWSWTSGDPSVSAPPNAYTIGMSPRPAQNIVFAAYTISIKCLLRNIFGFDSDISEGNK